MRTFTTHDWAEQKRREAEERRDEFFAERSDIPDLEFLTPDCSICGTSTDFDDGSFYCEVCCVTWKRSGYGHEAVRD